MSELDQLRNEAEQLKSQIRVSTTFHLKYLRFSLALISAYGICDAQNTIYVTFCVCSCNRRHVKPPQTHHYSKPQAMLTQSVESKCAPGAPLGVIWPKYMPCIGLQTLGMK